jgi:hypothetical protein
MSKWWFFEARGVSPNSVFYHIIVYNYSYLLDINNYLKIGLSRKRIHPRQKKKTPNLNTLTHTKTDLPFFSNGQRRTAPSRKRDVPTFGSSERNPLLTSK